MVTKEDDDDFTGKNGPGFLVLGRVINVWQVFQSWCSNHGIEPLTAKVGDVLSFLQESLDKGLSCHLPFQCAGAIFAIREAKKGRLLSHDPHVRKSRGYFLDQFTSGASLPYMELKFGAQGSIQASF